MTAVKNGIKTTLRTPGKTVLFSLILTALAALLSVSFCVFAAVRNYLDDCDDFYHTIVDIEYIGKDYPDGYVYDETFALAVNEHAPELRELLERGSVMRFEPVTHALAEVRGLSRTDKLIYDPNAAVFRIYVLGYDNNGGSFLVSVTETLYSRQNIDGKLIMMRTASMTSKPDLAIGDTYTVCGHFFTGSSSYPAFLAEPLALLGADGTATVPERTSPEDMTDELEAQYEALAEQMRVLNNSCTVQRTSAIEDLLPFHQQELTLREGRLFTAEEYSSSAKVCVISNRIADALEIVSGDDIDISLRTCEGDLYSNAVTSDGFERYTVVGVYDRNDDYPARIFIPCPSAAVSDVAASNGFRLGVCRIKNTGITDFLSQAKPLEQYGFRFTAYDQGYSAIVEPMSELMLISVVFLAVCTALTAGALCLQCHIFVTRQREAAQTMFALGSGRAHIRLYFLSSAAMLSVPAAIAGCVIGKLTESTVFRMLERFAAQFSEQDLRFSSSRMTLMRTLAFTPRVSPVIYAAAGLALLAGVLLFTLLFTRGVMKNRAVRKKSGTAPRAAVKVRRSSVISGKLKYALLSIGRSPVRTAAVLLLALLAALFFGKLTSSLDGYRDQLEAVRENTVLKGHSTDYFGRKIDGLVVYADAYDSLKGSELLSDVNLTRDTGQLRFSGIPVTADGVVHDIPEPTIPESSFAIETMIGQMYSEPACIATTSVFSNPVFYYSEPTLMEWLEGWDEEEFLEGRSVCVMPRQVMDKNGIALGDTAYFIHCYESMLQTVTLKIVGSYLSAAGDEAIFVPLKTENQHYYFRSRGYSSLVFTLDDVRDLDALRGALEDAGFAPVRTKGGARFFALIDDEVYLNTTRSMERQIKYVSVLYYSLYAITGVVGFVLSWLLVSSRRKEIALMRALGAKPSVVVLNFLFEQALLCGAGLALGLAALHAARQVSAPLLYLLVGAYFIVWTGSALACLVASVRKQAYAALSEPE